MAADKSVFLNRVDEVKQALSMLRRGEKISPNRQSNIAWFERAVGLKRPLTSYSARSQRRIFQRINEGARSAKEIQKKEYQARKQSQAKARTQHGMSPKQWQTIKPLADKLKQYGMDVDPYMEDFVLKDFATMYGYEYLRRVLTQQVDSTEQYLNGNAKPGHDRWNARGELENQFGASVHVQFIRGTNPYYYYHGRRA